MINANCKLEIHVEPKSNFRFRTINDFNHGTLSGIGDKEISVKLEGFGGNRSDVIVLCTILQPDGDYKMYPHPNLLIVKEKNGKKIKYLDPLESKLNAEWTATFPGMIILRTTKNMKEVTLNDKLERIRKYKPDCMENIKTDDKTFQKLIDKTFDMNNVRLCFEAFIKIGEEFQSICDPKFSNKIAYATKNVDGFLWYCHQSTGKVSGNEELIVVCDYNESIKKENIKVRYFENRCGWENFGIVNYIPFCPHSLVITTPSYHNVETAEDKKVFFELFTVTGEDRISSKPKEFIYKASDKIKSGKRKKENQVICSDVDKLIIRGVTEEDQEKLKSVNNLLTRCNFSSFPTSILKTDGKNITTKTTDKAMSASTKQIIDLQLLKELKIENTLHIVIKENNVSKLQDLLNVIKNYELEKILQLQNDHGDSVLHTACYFNRVEFVGKLLNLGVDLNIQNDEGDTALHIAVQHKQTDCINKILEQVNSENLDIDMNLTNDKGYTALYLAVLLEEYEIASILITTGNALVEFENPTNGNNILHLAVMQINSSNKEKTEEFVKLLLENTSIDVNVNVENHCDLNPVSLALEKGDLTENIINILMNYLESE